MQLWHSLKHMHMYHICSKFLITMYNLYTSGCILLDTSASRSLKETHLILITMFWVIVVIHVNLNLTILYCEPWIWIVLHLHSTLSCSPTQICEPWIVIRISTLSSYKSATGALSCIKFVSPGLSCTVHCLVSQQCIIVVVIVYQMICEPWIVLRSTLSCL